MTAPLDRFIGSQPYGLRIDTLVRLRWLAVAGQTVALLFVHWGLGFSLPIGPALTIVAVTAGINIALRVNYPGVQRLDDLRAGTLLAFDTVQLALLLYLTGGLTNPFAILFLAPVLISATVLSPRTTLALGMLVVAAASVLFFFQYPLPWYPGESFKPPVIYEIGTWLALVVSVAFIGGYAWTVANETRQLAEALAETELVLMREQHLSALDGLAAAAAHELGTPLATIAVVIREIERSLPDNSPLADDVRLLREQSERCRAILATLTSLDSGDAPFDRMPLSHLLDEVVTRHRPIGVPLSIELPRDKPNEPIVARNPAILYGLGNLVENATDFADKSVAVAADWNDDEVTISVTDDGPGFPPEVISRVGEPYVTRRRARDAEGRGGLGLGLFIAKTLLERTGAALSFKNRVPPETGAMVQVRWPRSNLDIRAAAAQQTADAPAKHAEIGGSLASGPRPT